ncbi:MAG: amino acid kinase family protein [Candidatus Methanospirareceae archaeon]
MRERDKRGSRRVIIKLGGSLMAKGRDIVKFLKDYAKKMGKNIIIIPGGGVFVESIRNIKDVKEDTAHWMAILGMHQYGLFLADGEIPVVESIEEVDSAGEICIFLPYKTLREDDSLRHSWDVTSDTIAAFIAKKLGEREFIKLTDVDGVMVEGEVMREIKAEDMVEKSFLKNSCIDKELPYFLKKEKMRCIVINGNFLGRIKDAVEGKEVVGTKILGI